MMDKKLTDFIKRFLGVAIVDGKEIDDSLEVYQSLTDEQKLKVRTAYFKDIYS